MAKQRNGGGRFWAYNEYEFNDGMLGPYKTAAKARAAAKRKYPDAEHDEIKVTRKGPSASEQGGLLDWLKGLFR